MKRKILIVLFLFLLVGCTKIEDLSYEQIINRVVNSQAKLTNQYRNGYKYYVPRGLMVENSKEYNEQISNELYKYYLYIDVISYFNNTNQDYVVDDKAIYSKSFIYNNIHGYLEINIVKEKYLVEMMYNYAKIEVIVDEDYLNLTILNSITILSSIQYNYKIINSYMGEDVLNFTETEINIFETKKTESNVIKYREEYGNYEEPEENTIPDTDLIN